VVYTQWLNEQGGIEADVTVTRLADDAFMIVTVAASQRRDSPGSSATFPQGARVHIATSRRASR
jgi:glycine cleavage system aminomethyltransferase T